jgi:hypothetical protein
MTSQHRRYRMVQFPAKRGQAEASRTCGAYLAQLTEQPPEWCAGRPLHIRTGPAGTPPPARERIGVLRCAGRPVSSDDRGAVGRWHDLPQSCKSARVYLLLAQCCRNLVVQEVGSHLEYTGRRTFAFGKAACDAINSLGRANVFSSKTGSRGRRGYDGAFGSPAILPVRPTGESVAFGVAPDARAGCQNEKVRARKIEIRERIQRCPQSSSAAKNIQLPFFGNA